MVSPRAAEMRILGFAPVTILALFSIWIIWGTVYIFVRYAIQSIPALMMNGTRFIAAGVGMLVALRIAGAAWPTRVQVRNAAFIGLMLNAGSQGAIALAQNYIPAGMVAVIVATSPLWTVVAAAPILGWPTRSEWLGIFIGLAGVLLLVREPTLIGQPIGIGLVMFGMLSWAVGSAFARKLALPRGLMAAAVQLPFGGVVLMVASALYGETWPAHISVISALSWLYLVVVGSVLAFSAYLHTLKHVRPALAGAYAYINPLVALGLSALLFGETVTPQGFAAIGVILSGVVFMTRGKR